MQADWQATSKVFAEGMLSPTLPMPSGLGHDPKRYDVYRNNVTMGLVNALELNFPAITRLVGRDFFRAMARDFAQAYPPSSPLMFEYGNELPSFIAVASQLAEYPYLPDVASLEILWRQSYHEANAPVLAGQALAQLQPEQMFATILSPHPTFRMFKSDYPVATIMRANRSTDPVPTIANEPEHMIIVRPNLDVSVTIVSKELFTFVSSLVSGKPLGTAADETLSHFSDANLPELLAQTLSNCAFTSILEQ